MSSPSDPQITHLIQRIRQDANDHDHPFIVAIDGRSGAGKSTLAQRLGQHLASTILSGDDFFAGGETISTAPAETLAHTCMDWQTQRIVLQRLRAAQPARFHPYDWAAFNGSKSPTPIQIDPAPVILFEGVYAARPELRDLLDLTILIETPKATRIDRLTKREGGISPWEQQWHRAEDWYFANLAPAQGFDIIVG